MTARVWHCVYTKHEAEMTARHSLKELGLTVFLPRFKVVRSVRGVMTPVREALFPRYLFVLNDEESWKAAHYARGVENLLGGDSGRPYIIRDEVIAALRDRCDAEEIYSEGGPVKAAAAKRQPGTAVSQGQAAVVTTGPLAGMTGICTMSSKKRVEVMLTLFGRTEPVSFHPSQVAEAS